MTINKKKNSKKIEIEHIQCVWGLMCSSLSIDETTHNLSIFNIIEQLNIPSKFFDEQEKQEKPLIFPFINELVLFWKRTLNTNISNEEILTDIKIKIIDPLGNPIQETLAPIKFQRGIKRMRFRIGMSGIALTVPGDYVHQIELKTNDGESFKKVLEVPFEVVKI